MTFLKKSTETKITRLINRIVSVLFFAVCVAYGSDKNIGQSLDDFAEGIAQTFASGLLTITNFFSRDEIETGYAVASVETNETHNLTTPDNAVLAENIAKRGAHDDGFYLYDSFTNHLERTGLITTNMPWVHTDGTITLKARNLGLPLDGIDFYESYSNVTVYAPRYGKYGFLPGSLWPSYTNSLIWTAVNESGSRVITWQNSLENRLPDYRSFQIEFKQGGEITYRYAPMLGNISTNSVGLYRNAHAQLITAPTNTTSITLSYIGDLSDGSGDTDGDGLSDYAEVKIHHTNPTLADSDGDGLSDSTEIENGTDPDNLDSNGDGVIDSIDIIYEPGNPHKILKAAHGLSADTNYTRDSNDNGVPDWVEDKYGDEENSYFKLTVSLSTPPPVPGVLFAGDVKLLITAAGTWDLWLGGGIEYAVSYSPNSYQPDFTFTYNHPDVIRYGYQTRARSSQGGTKYGIFALLNIKRLEDYNIDCCHGNREFCATFEIKPDISRITDFSVGYSDYIKDGDIYKFKNHDLNVLLFINLPDSEVVVESLYLNHHCYNRDIFEYVSTSPTSRYIFIVPNGYVNQEIGINIPDNICCSCWEHNPRAGYDWKCTLSAKSSNLIVQKGNDTISAGAEFFLDTTLKISAQNVSSGHMSDYIEINCKAYEDNTDTFVTNFVVRHEYTVLPCDRPPVRLEAITTEANNNGVIYNPSGVGTGDLALYKAFNDYPNLIPDDTIYWTKDNDNVRFYLNEFTGDEVIVRGISEGDFKLTVNIEGFPDSYKPYINGRVVSPVTNRIKAYIMCDTNGVPAVTEAKVNEWIAEANRIYRQIAVSFVLDSVERVVNQEWYDIEDRDVLYDMFLSRAGNECIKVHFVNSLYRNLTGITSHRSVNQDGNIWAYIAVKSSANNNTLAHELGHAGGLSDILIRDSSILTSSQLQEHNWTGGNNTGFYEYGVTHDNIVRRLLMYYSRNMQKCDIPISDVVGNSPRITSTGALSVGINSFIRSPGDEPEEE